MEALNVNISVNQSEKAVCAGCWHRNRAVFCSTPETGAGKNLPQDGMTHAAECVVEFMALISGACVRGFRVLYLRSRSPGFEEVISSFQFVCQSVSSIAQKVADDIPEKIWSNARRRETVDYIFGVI